MQLSATAGTTPWVSATSISSSRMIRAGQKLLTTLLLPLLLDVPAGAHPLQHIVAVDDRWGLDGDVPVASVHRTHPVGGGEPRWHLGECPVQSRRTGSLSSGWITSAQPSPRHSSQLCPVTCSQPGLRSKTPPSAAITRPWTAAAALARRRRRGDAGHAFPVDVPTTGGQLSDPPVQNLESRPRRRRRAATDLRFEPDLRVLPRSGRGRTRTAVKTPAPPPVPV